MDRLMAGPIFEKFYADASLLAYHPSNKQKRTKKEREGDVMSELLVRKGPCPARPSQGGLAFWDF